MDRAEGARRFDQGERSNPIQPAMAEVALSQIQAWTPGRIASTLGVLVEQIAGQAEARGWQVPPRECRSPHFVGIRRAEGWPQEAQARLAEKDVYLSRRGDALRVSPYLYNHEGHVQRLFQALDTL